MSETLPQSGRESTVGPPRRTVANPLGVYVDLNTVVEVVRRPTDRPGASWHPGDAWLAGGTWLFSEPQPSVRRLVDLTELGWPSLASDAGGLEIAATCT